MRDPFLIVAALAVLAAVPLAILAGIALRSLRRLAAADPKPTARSTPGGREAQRDPPGRATFTDQEEPPHG